MNAAATIAALKIENKRLKIENGQLKEAAQALCVADNREALKNNGRPRRFSYSSGAAPSGDLWGPGITMSSGAL